MSWTPLNITQSDGSNLPPLLVSAAFRPDSYTVHLTDLTHIWSEALQRRDIFRRSLDENTSIDPTDGNQLQVLLDKIKLGLEGSKNTTLELAVGVDTGQPGITLNVTVPLPGGLAPLEWPLNLSAAPQSLLTSQLIIPLLEAQQLRMQEMASLTDALREKDHVIQKLVDKLESQGTQISQVFPQAAGKGGRKVDRKKAEEKVKGLGPFDMEAWKKELGNEEPRNVGHLIGTVFAIDGSSNLSVKTPTSVSKGPDNWWKKAKGHAFALSGESPASGEQSRTSEKKKSVKSEVGQKKTVPDDDGFQVQATPPRLASPAKEPTGAAQPTDSSTDDDDDLDAPSQRSDIPQATSPSKPPTKVPPKKLGLVGKKKEPPKPPSQPDGDTTDDSISPPPDNVRRSETRASPVAQASPPKSKRTLGRIGGKKETPPEPEPESEAVKEQPKPVRGRLGQIGGKKKATPTPSPTSPEPEPEPEAEAEPVASPKTAGTKKKLGTIGARKGEKVAEQEAKGDEDRGRAVKREIEEPPPRETSEERADRKREQLRIELEEKAKAPVKKKRKF